MTRFTPPDEGFCQTAGCFAGHVAFADGFMFRGNYLCAEPVVEHPDGRMLRTDEEVYPGEELGDPSVWPRSTATVAGYAADRLELTPSEARELFNGGNSLERLEERVRAYCREDDRSEESKLRLKDTMERVRHAAEVGLWDQGDWITIREEDS